MHINYRRKNVHRGRTLWICSKTWRTLEKRRVRHHETWLLNRERFDELPQVKSPFRCWSVRMQIGYY